MNSLHTTILSAVAILAGAVLLALSRGDAAMISGGTMLLAAGAGMLGMMKQGAEKRATKAERKSAEDRHRADSAVQTATALRVRRDELLAEREPENKP